MTTSLMKTISLLLLAATTGLLPASMLAADVTGSGHVTSETRQVSGFHGVNLTGSGEVIVTQGDTEGLVIDAEDNILPLIESTVTDGSLRLGFKDHVGNVHAYKTVVYHLSVKTLDHLAIEGSGTIHAATLTAGRAKLSLPGSGVITVDEFKADTVETEIEGSGKVKLVGEAHRETVSIDGSGSYAAKGFKTGDAEVTINGSGEAKVQVGGALAVAINGSGSVEYSGHAAVTKSINGSGHVHPSDVKNDE